jgi:hypothetical protein
MEIWHVMNGRRDAVEVALFLLGKYERNKN